MCKSGHNSMFFYILTTFDNKGREWVHKNRIRSDGAYLRVGKKFNIYLESVGF